MNISHISVRGWRWLACIAAGCAITCRALADVSFSVSVDTSPLAGHAAGPFSLDFQLIDGAGFGDQRNTAFITNVSAPMTGLPTLTGGAAGNLQSNATLRETAFFNEIYQRFTPGSSISFKVSLSTNLNPGGPPDAFVFSLLDSSLASLPSTGPGNVLLLVNIDAGIPTVQSFATDPSISPNAGGPGININGITISNFTAFVTFTSPVLQNSAPVGIPTTANFLVVGPVFTGGPGESNTVNSLAFVPGSSLLINNTLFVTQGPVTLVPGSSITLNGYLVANQLQMLFGSSLGGTGGIAGELINGGIVSPGHSPGAIRVTGNYTQTAAGVLRMEIGGRSLPQHDLLSVGGTATLGGTLQLVRLNNFDLKRGAPVTFLTADGGVRGRFSLVQDEFTSDTILRPTVIYHSTSVDLEAIQGSFEDYASDWHLTPNQKSVARVLDSAAGRRRANALFDYLDYRKLSELPRDFDKIAPEELTSVFTLGVSLAGVQAQNIQRRTDDLRSGFAGFNAANFAVNGNRPSYSGVFGTAGPSGPASPSPAMGDEGKMAKETKAVVPEENRWGAFLSGTGEWVSVNGTENARGYDLQSGGFTLGADYKVTPNLAIGLAAGYIGTTADLSEHGRVWVNGGTLGLYATFFENKKVPSATETSKDSSKEIRPTAANVVKGFYADLAVDGGYNSYDTRRSALQGEARGDTDGGEVNALVGLGYDFRAGGVTVGPTATFNYTYIGTKEFAEHGSLAPLDIRGGKGESLRGSFGFKASSDWKLGGVIVKPELRAAWQHEYGDSSYGLNSSFTNGAGNCFLVNGPKFGRDAALVGAGFAVQLNDRTVIYGYYDGELGRRNYESNAVTGGFRFAF